MIWLVFAVEDSIPSMSKSQITKFELWLSIIDTTNCKKNFLRWSQTIGGVPKALLGRLVKKGCRISYNKLYSDFKQLFVVIQILSLRLWKRHIWLWYTIFARLLKYSQYGFEKPPNWLALFQNIIFADGCVDATQHSSNSAIWFLDFNKILPINSQILRTILIW